MQDKRFFVVGIGYSAGGLQAVIEFLECLPASPGAAFVIVPHLLPTYRSQLDMLLASYCKLPISRVSENMEVKENQVYLLQENTILEIEGNILQVRPRPSGERINKAIDTFLLSLAESKKKKAVAIIMSGMGNDGLEGSRHVNEMGGYVLAQHPLTATHDSMPEHVIKFDNPLAISAPCDLARFLMDILQKSQVSEH